MRRLPDGLDTVPPRAARCGGCVLTPPSTRRCPKTGRTAKNTLSPSLENPAPFMNAAIARIGGRREPAMRVLRPGVGGYFAHGRTPPEDPSRWCRTHAHDHDNGTTRVLLSR